MLHAWRVLGWVHHGEGEDRAICGEDILLISRLLNSEMLYTGAYQSLPENPLFRVAFHGVQCSNIMISAWTI